MKRNKIFIFFLVALMLLSMATTVVAETQYISSQDNSKDITADLEKDPVEDDSISENSEDMSKQPDSSSSILDDRAGSYTDKEAGSTSVQTGRYRILTMGSYKPIVPVLNGSTYDGGKVKLKSDPDIDDDWYIWSGKTDGIYRIKHVKSGYYLIAKPPSTTRDLSVQPFIDDDRQRWRFTFYGDSLFVLTNVNFLTVMDVSGGWSYDGTQVIHYPPNQGSNQLFCLQKSEEQMISASAEEFKNLSVSLYRANTILKFNVFASDEDKVAVQDAINYGYEVYGNDKAISDQVNEARDALEAVACLRSDKYRIVGKQSGKNILSTVSSGTDTGKVALFANTMEISKEWNIERLSNGYYTLKYLENNLFLSVDPEKKDTNSQLILQPHTGNLQEWEAIFDSSGLFMFSNPETGKYMTVSGGLTAIGTPLVQYPNGKVAAQKFILHKSSADVSGTTTEHAELNTALARLKLILDIDFFLSDDDKKDAQKAYDDGLIVFNDTNAYSEQLYFAKYTADAQTYLRKGRYRLTGKQSGKYILPALSWINYDKSKVKLASSANSADEWYFERVSDGTYVIQHMKSSYYLTPDPSNLNNDGNLLVLPYTRTYLQRWELDFNDDNSAIRFYDIHTEKFMSVSGSLTTDGTQVIQSVKSDTGNQDFILSKSGGDAVASATEFEELNTALVHLKTIIDFDFFDSQKEKDKVKKVYDDGMKVFEQKETKSLLMYITKEDVLEQTYPRTGRYRITGLSSNKNVVPTLYGENYYLGRVKLSGTADDLSDWLLERQPDGSYIVEHLRSGYCLTPIEKNSDSDLMTVSFNDEPVQKWMILVSDEANAFLFCNRETGKYMDVSGNSVEEGAQLIQYPFLNGKNQKFYLTKSNADALATPKEIEGLNDAIKRLKVIVDLDSYLTTKDKEATQKSYRDAVDVYNNKKATAVLVEHTKEDVVSQTYLRSGRYRVHTKDLNQQALVPNNNIIKLSTSYDDVNDWYFERLIDGTYVVEHVRNGYCLSPDPNKKNTDCNLMTVPFIDTRWQKWELSFDLEHSFTFYNLSTTKCMDITQFDDFFEEYRVIQRNPTGGGTQKFIIEKSRFNNVGSSEDFEKLNRAVERIKMIADFDLFAFRDDREIVKQAYSDASAVYDNKSSTVAQISYATQAAITQAYLRDGEYDLVGKQSDKYILPLGYDKGQVVVLNSKKGSADNEGWDLERQADGSYIIRHMQSSIRGNYLSVDPENPNSETLITTSNTASDVQRWEIIFNDDNSLTFRNVQTQNYMDVCGNGTEDGTKVIQFQSNNANNQKFSLRRSKMDVKASEDEFNQLNNIIQRMKMLIGLDNFDHADDKELTQKVYNFAMGTYGDKTSTMAEVNYATKMLEGRAFLRNGRYYLIGKQSGKYVLPVDFRDGSKMLLESIRDFTDYEDWKFERQSDGTYTMQHFNLVNRPVNIFFFLGLNPKDTNNQELMMTYPTGTDVQKWELIFDDNNVLMLRNLNSGKYLNVLDGGTEELTKVIQFDFKNTENQKFILKTSYAATGPYRDTHMPDRRRALLIDGFHSNEYELWS